MSTLRLMADYECYPWWTPEGDNVNPLDLPITTDLAAALNEWGDAYTATLNRSDPSASGFVDEVTARAWLSEGADLAERFRQQGFEVVYFHDGEAGVGPGRGT